MQAFNSPKNSGFSLIELMVVMAISSLILITVSTLFITVLSTDGRTSLRRSLKAEGTQALNQMTFLLRNAKPIDYDNCLNLQDEDEATFTLSDGEDTTFELLGAPSSARIASSSAVNGIPATYYLNPETVRIPVGVNGIPLFKISCSQSDEPDSTEGQYIEINFTLERLNNETGTNITEEFLGGVHIRNARDQ